MYSLLLQTVCQKLHISSVNPGISYKRATSLGLFRIYFGNFARRRFLHKSITLILSSQWFLRSWEDFLSQYGHIGALWMTQPWSQHGTNFFYLYTAVRVPAFKLLYDPFYALHVGLAQYFAAGPYSISKEVNALAGIGNTAVLCSCVGPVYPAGKQPCRSIMYVNKPYPRVLPGSSNI